MAVTHIDILRPARGPEPVGFGPDGVLPAEAVATRYARLRRRRAQLETFFTPVVSPAALPSAIDRLVLWRSRHARHLG